MRAGKPAGDSIHLGQGYCVDATGIRLWPLRRYHRRWENVESVSAGGLMIKDSWHFVIDLRFAVARRRKLRLMTRRRTKDLLNVVRVLSWVKAAKPAAAVWSDPMFADLFAAAAAAENPAPFQGNISDDLRVRRAELRCAALNFEGAIEDWTSLIERQSAFARKAAQMKVRVLLSTGRLDDAIDTVGAYVQSRPEDTEVRTELAIALIAMDDKRAGRLTRIILERTPKGNPSLFISLAWQAIRNRDWAGASRRLDHAAAFEPLLSEVERESLKQARERLERFRASPKTAFTQSTLPNLAAKWSGMLALVFFSALLLLPAISVAPPFVRESWSLLRLAREGKKAELVDVYKPDGRTFTEGFIEEVRYQFAPDAEKAEPLDFKPPALGSKDFDRWFEKERRKLDDFRHTGRFTLHEGWFEGSSILLESTAEGIRADPSLQFVTYLPSDHSVSAIGPITWTRICLTWIGAPWAMLPAVLLVVVFAATGAAQIRRRRRRQSLGYEI